jgi:hypothetical protein
MQMDVSMLPSFRSLLSAKCKECGIHHDEPQWSQLEIVAQICLEDVRDLLTAWPWALEIVIQIRRCSCGRSLSACSRRVI